MDGDQARGLSQLLVPSLVVVAFVLSEPEDGRARGMRAGGHCTRASLQVPKRVFPCQPPVCPSVPPTPLSSRLSSSGSPSPPPLILSHPSPPSWALPGPLTV